MMDEQKIKLLIQPNLFHPLHFDPAKPVSPFALFAEDCKLDQDENTLKMWNNLHQDIRNKFTKLFDEKMSRYEKMKCQNKGEI